MNLRLKFFITNKQGYTKGLVKNQVKTPKE